MSAIEAIGELGLAVAQFAPGADTVRNLEAIRALTARAVDHGADLVVFPEYSSFFVDPVSAPFVDAAEQLDGPFVRGLGRIAAEHGVHIVAGMVEATGEAGKFSNTLVALDAAGRVVATYRKQHLYDAFGARESDWVVPGPLAECETFEVNGLRVGLQTCYDLRFPEVTRRVVDAGADIVAVPAEWVRGPLKEYHWATLLAARAIENTIYLAAADHTGPVGVGLSRVVDPAGIVLADAGTEPGVGVARAGRARVESVRGVNPALELRRFRVVER